MSEGRKAMKELIFILMIFSITNVKVFAETSTTVGVGAGEIGSEQIGDEFDSDCCQYNVYYGNGDNRKSLYYSDAANLPKETYGTSNF